MLKNMILFTNLSLLLLPLPIFNHYIYDNMKDNFKNNEVIEYILNEVNDDYDIPETSSQVYNLPWRNDEDFLEAKDKYNTPILMAGFCAVLKNPLPGEEFNVSLAAQSVNGKVVKPDKIFSQNSSIGPYNERNGYKVGATYVGGKIVMDSGGGVCKIATTLYNLVVLSNLDIVERYNHSMPINYVPYGQDATVAYGVKDFIFKNTTDGNILIWSELIGNRLYMGFYGIKHAPEVTWSHEITNIVKPSIKYVKNEKLNNGEMKTVIQGLDGATVKSKIQIKYKDGTIKVKDMGISQYIPLPELIEIN
ncbi:MAG: VanW family protein [Tissierellaceae bacterium]|nr:VanW family protein [Tissierellaceae bacterium]